MARYWDDDDENSEQQEPTPRGLRKQLEEMAAKLAERDAAIAELQKVNRQRNVSDGLRDLGIQNVDKIARLVPADVADSPEKLKSWVEDYKDVFSPASVSEATAVKNTLQDEAGTQAKPNLPDEQIQAFQRIQTADNAAGTTTPDLEAQHLAQLIAARQASGGDFDKYIAILRGETDSF